MTETKDIHEQTFIAGALPLLALTTDVSQSLAAVATVLLSAFLAALVFHLGGKRLPGALAWLFPAGVAALVGYVLTLLLPYIIPVTDRAIPFVMLSSVSPVVFFGCSDDAAGGLKSTAAALFVFAVVIVLLGVVREAAGIGTVFGIPVWPGNVAPAVIARTPMGALFFLGLVLTVNRYVKSKRAGTTRGESPRLKPATEGENQ